MSLSEEEVRKIAHLGGLAIRDENIPRYAQSLSSILDLVNQMEAVDTAEIQPMAHPLDAIQRLRPDEVRETDQRAEFQPLAPQVENGLYLVPKVIE